MDIRTQSALLAAIVGVALGVSMLLRSGRPRVLTRFSLFALSVGGFYFATFLLSLLSPDSPRFLGRVADGATFVLGALVPFAALSFFLEFLGVGRRSQRWGERIAFFSPFLAFLVSVTPLSQQLWARMAVTGWIFLGLFGAVGVLLHRRQQTDSRIERARLAYLTLGAVVTVTLAGTDLLYRFGIPFPVIGPLASSLYLFFWNQTLLRLRLMDLQEFLGKVASQTVLAIILAAVFLTLTVWVGGNTSLFLFNTAVGAFVVIILLEPLREWVDERVLGIFFRERFALLQSLSALKVKIANIIEAKELAKVVLDALYETGRVTHASVYLLAEDRPGYRLLDARGPQPLPYLDMGGARPLLNAAGAGQKAILLETLERRLQDLRAGQPMENRRSREEIRRLNDLRATLSMLKAGICVPLIGSERVIGFLNLWDERVPEAFASDEIAVVLEISEQVSTAIENSKLYDQMRERDRLAALGEMAAGLAHEIRNPLGAIKGAAQCLDPKKLTGEDGEFLDVIVEEVNRLNGVVTAFLDYSRPLKQSFGATELNEVVTRTARLIQTDVPDHLQMSMDLTPNLERVDGDAEQLKQVLINLIQNAIQALGKRPGQIWVKTLRSERISTFQSHQDFVEVHVVDDGPGIPVDQQPSIFVPFFTTKQKGTGLGLAICQRIVKNHGGTIAVQSRVGEGTTFVVRLPALPSEQKNVDLPVPAGTPFPQISPPSEGPKKKRRKGAA